MQHVSTKKALRITGEIRVHGVEFSRILFHTDDLLIQNDLVEYSYNLNFGRFRVYLLVL